MEGNIIEVRPLDVKRWHGKTIKEYNPSPVVLECFVDRYSRKYKTGLNDEDRKRLENLTGLNLNDNFDPENPHPFYGTDNGRVRLYYNRPNRFDMRKPIDEIKIKLLMNHPLVANSMSEWEEGHDSRARFVIFDSQDEVKKKAEKMDKRMKIYNQWAKMELAEKRQVVQILGNADVSNQSVEFVDSRMSDIIETKGYDVVLDILGKSKTDKYLQSVIISAVDKNVIQKRGDLYYYMDEPMGGIYDAVAYLKDPKNNAIKGQIIDKLNLK